LKKTIVSCIIFCIPVMFFLLTSCAGGPTPAGREAMTAYMTEEYSLLIEVNSNAAKNDMFKDISITINGKNWIFKAEPLFPLEDILDDRYGYKSASHWLILTSIPDNKEPVIYIHPWSLGHNFIRQVEKELHEHILTVEADIHHNWYFDDLRRHIYYQTSCETKKPLHSWPYEKEFCWHLDDGFSQLRSAREYVANNPHIPVRIAHLDTGYDPLHITYPADRMRLDLGYNFYENTDDARDPGTRGFFYQPGHGTGTLALLAGTHITWPSQYGFPAFDDYVGAAITAEIVPVRVYPSVVQFKTRYMAQGIYYAMAPREEPENICHVISLSMGGVASRAWAQAVNLVYLSGVTIFAASGDRFGISPPATTVYPARFHRVVSVTGATSDYTPYYKKRNMCRLQESFGPDSIMHNTIATYVPNVPWAQYDCEQTVNLDGGGTSASTPQAAGAAALWLQIHGNDYYHEDEGWKMVEAVRTALFHTAKKDIPGMQEEEVFHYFGNGVLKAMDAIEYAPDIHDLTIQPEDTVTLPLLTLLAEYFESFFDEKNIDKGIRDVLKDMYELEIVQLQMGSASLQKIIGDHEQDPASISTNDLKKFVKRLITSDKASAELKEVMKYIYNALTA
jgi:hypothetical protein